MLYYIHTELGGKTVEKPNLVYSSKINKIRSFALILLFVGILIMYGGILTKSTPWLMFVFFGLGVLFDILSTLVYFWIGLLSTRAVPIICPSCERPTKMLGVVDGCMCCKKPEPSERNVDVKSC